MGTSISFVPTTGFDVQHKDGQTKIITHSQCITTMMVYENKSLEELRFEDYQLGRRGTKDGYGTSLYRFEPPWHTEEVYIGDDLESKIIGKLQSITGMKEYKGTSFEELRLEDYRDGRGPKFNQFSEKSGSVFGKVFQQSGQPQNETVYCNLINNLNITLPHVNFLGSPSQQRQILSAKHRLQHTFKSLKTTNPINNTMRFGAGVLNKSLDTVISTVAQIGNFDNDLRVNNAYIGFNNDVGEGSKGNDINRKVIALDNDDDTEMIVLSSDETPRETRDENSTSDLEKEQLVTISQAKDNVNIDDDPVTNKIERGIGISFNSDKVLNDICKDESSNLVKENCKESNTPITEPSTSHEKGYISERISVLNEDVNKTLNKTQNISISIVDNHNCGNQKIDIDSINLIAESQCETNIQTAKLVTDTVYEEKENSQEPNNNNIDLGTNIEPVIESLSTSNEVTDNFSSNANINEDVNNESSNTINGEDNSTKSLKLLCKNCVEEVKATNTQLEQPEQSQVLSENTVNQNNMIENYTNVLGDAINNLNKNKSDEINEIFCFNAVPTSRMIVKPSKLKNITFETPKSGKSPIKILNKTKSATVVTNTTTNLTRTKTDISPKSIFSGYPFINPNSKDRFNFVKENDADKKATLSAHLRLFSNDTPKADSFVSESNVPEAATARFIRKFTPFSFKDHKTADTDNSKATNPATFSTSTSKVTSPFIRVSFAQKRTITNPIAQSGPIFGSGVNEPNTSTSNNLNIFTSPKNISTLTTVSPLNIFKPFSFSTVTSVPSNSFTSKSPGFTIKPATFKKTAAPFASNFGVDIINFGASTSKQCMVADSLTYKSDIAPSFQELSVSNERNTAPESGICEMQSMPEQTAVSSTELPKQELTTCMSVDELNSIEEPPTADSNQSSVNQPSDSQSDLSTEVKSLPGSSISAFKGSSVPSLFKGKSLVKKSSMVKISLPANASSLEFNKPLHNSLPISPIVSTPSRSKSCSKDTAHHSSVSLTSTSSASVVKNPFYLGSNEDSPIKRKVAARQLKPQFKLANSKLSRPAFDFSDAAKVSVNLSFSTINLGGSSSSQSATNMFGKKESFNTASSNSAGHSSPVNQASNQSLTSVFHNFDNLANPTSQSNAPSLQTLSISNPNSQPSTSSIHFQNATAVSPVPTFSFIDEVAASVNQSALTPPSNPTSIFSILNTESLHPLVLHREKHRYSDVMFNNGVVTNASHHPRDLYFFSAIPVIINQIFTIKVTELFNVTNNDIVIGFTAVDPCGINVLEIPGDPLKLIDRLEYWVFETFKLQIDDEIKFQLKQNGEVEFYKNFRYTNSYFVDATITLWLFIYIKNGIRTFRLRTNEVTDVSVIEAMEVPVVDTATNLNSDRRISHDDEVSNESIRDNNRMWNSQIPPFVQRQAVRRNIQNNINILRNNASSVRFSRHQNLHNIFPDAAAAALDRFKLFYQANSDVNRNRNPAPFLNVTGVNQFNPKKNVKQSVNPVVLKPKRQESENDCIICCDKGIDCVLYTCGHSCMCLECGISILRQGDSKCPICRKIICDVIKIYKS